MQVGEATNTVPDVLRSRDLDMNVEKFGRIVFVPGLNKSRYPFCNSVFIDDDRKVVIDPASDDKLLQEIAPEEGFDILINSHYHEDHFAFNYLFPRSELYVPINDAPCFQSMDTMLEYYGMKDTPYEQVWKRVLIDSFHYQERASDRLLEDGEILDFGHTQLEVVHTPGHTIGHCSFYCPQEGVLILGDYDLTSFGPWYGDASSDIRQTRESVHKLLNIPADVYITSHEEGIIKGDIKVLAEAYLDIIDQRQNEIMKFLRKSRSLDDIVRQWIIYKKPREPKQFYEFSEQAMIKKHLDLLMEDGKLEIRQGKYVCI